MIRVKMIITVDATSLQWGGGFRNGSASSMAPPQNLENQLHEYEILQVYAIHQLGAKANNQSLHWRLPKNVASQPQRPWTPTINTKTKKLKERH